MIELRHRKVVQVVVMQLIRGALWRGSDSLRESFCNFGFACTIFEMDGIVKVCGCGGKIGRQRPVSAA